MMTDNDAPLLVSRYLPYCHFYESNMQRGSVYCLEDVGMCLCNLA